MAATGSYVMAKGRGVRSRLVEVDFSWRTEITSQVWETSWYGRTNGK
jgi:hypothetical protein